MPRRKDYDQPKLFTPASDKPIVSGNSRFAPQVRGRNEILEDPEARSLVGKVLGEVRKSWYVQPVRSNAELLERLDEYFEMAEGRDIPPTVEEMSLYCGVTSQSFNDWKNGRRGFRDELESGLTTADICKKAFEIMHTVDAVLTEQGKLNTVAYIFRSKNYYGMRDQQEVVVEAKQRLDKAMTPEEIAKNLPDGNIRDTESSVE